MSKAAKLWLNFTGFDRPLTFNLSSEYNGCYFLLFVEKEEEECQLIPWRAPRNVVIQNNALAEAKYRLSVRAQKLLIRLLDELDQNDEHFPAIKLFLRDFAKLSSGDPHDVTFREFDETARQFMGQFVHITQSPVPGEKLPRSIICHWVSHIVSNPNEKSLTFSFDSILRPYLLCISKNFFAFPTMYAFNLDSVYSIRLYQWAKSRAFLKCPQEVSIEDLRHFIGTVDIDSKGNVFKERLRRYNDFKKVALEPAIREINRKTDLFVRLQEVKRPGTKLVSALILRITTQERPGESPRVTQLLINSSHESSHLADLQTNRTQIPDGLAPRDKGKFFLEPQREDFESPGRQGPEKNGKKKVSARSPRSREQSKTPQNELRDFHLFNGLNAARR